MNHPCKDWHDTRTYDLKKEKQAHLILDKQIRFKGLTKGDERDHEMCFQWEFNRTRKFLDQTIEDEKNHDLFPFYIDSFPDKPYLSHSPKIRSTWRFIKEENTFNYEEDLLHPFLGTNEEVDLGFMKGKLLSYKVPLTLHINPSWNKTKFRSLVREQTDNIYRALESEKKYYEGKGYIFALPDNTQPIRYWSRMLKALGHFRLLKCVGLDEDRVRHWYGEDCYDDEQTIKREIKRSLPVFFRK
jgi:hypothetical protein